MKGTKEENKNGVEKIELTNTVNSIGDRIINTYFSFEKNKLLLNYFKGYDKLMIEFLKDKTEFDEKSFYELEHKAINYHSKFFSEHTEMQNDVEIREKIKKFSNAYMKEFTYHFKETEIKSKGLNLADDILKQASFVDESYEYENVIKGKLEFIRTLGEKNTDHKIQHIHWLKKENLTDLVNEINIHGITTTTANLKRFFNGENVEFTIPFEKMEYFAWLVKRLHKEECFKMSSGKLNYSVFQNHIKDFSKSFKKYFFRKTASKLNKEDPLKNKILIDVETILLVSKIIIPQKVI